MGRSANSDGICRECDLNQLETVQHFWETCPRWGQQRQIRGDSTTRMVNDAEASLEYIRTTVLSRTFAGAQQI